MKLAENRRPLASRNTGWAHKLTQALARTSIQPNHLSIGSMVFAALAGGLFFIGAQASIHPSSQASGTASAIALLIAALACQCRLLCNLFDGMLAIEAGRHSADGVAWNEFPDRYADIVIFVGIGYGVGMPSLGWAAACFAVLTAYTRELGNSIGAGGDFSGPMAKQHRMAVVTLAAVLAAALSWAGVSLGADSAINLPNAILIIALSVVCAGALLTAVLRAMGLVRRLNNPKI